MTYWKINFPIADNFKFKTIFRKFHKHFTTFFFFWHFYEKFQTQTVKLHKTLLV